MRLTWLVVVAACEGAPPEPYCATFEMDADGDGRVDIVGTDVYDDTHRLVRREEDFQQDGRIDRVSEWLVRDAALVRTVWGPQRFWLASRTRRTSGVLAEVESDQDGDGLWDVEIRVTARNAAGEPTEQVQRVGEQENGWSRAYDSRSRPVLWDVDFGHDGVIDNRTTWTYERGGDLVVEELDRDVDGTADQRITTSYRGDQPQWQEQDLLTGNGPEVVTTWEWDGERLLSLEESAFDEWRRTTNTYDEAGRRRAESVDSSMASSSTTWTVVGCR